MSYPSKQPGGPYDAYYPNDPYADPSPPPYTTYNNTYNPPAVQVPQYEAPTYNSSTDDSKTLQAATIKFPPTMNGYYQWKFTMTFHLGLSSDERLYAVSTHSTLFSKRHTITLHDGPSDKDPTLATLTGEMYGKNTPFVMTIPTPPGTHQHPRVENMTGNNSHNHVSTLFSFELSGPKNGLPRERFEWRTSRGKEIKELANHSYGWKLVRLSGPASGIGGSRDERDEGFTSDGKEIVAALAHSASWSATKGFTFAFMGSGLTGLLGEKWEIMAVLSAMQLWEKDRQAVGVAIASA